MIFRYHCQRIVIGVILLGATWRPLQAAEFVHSSKAPTQSVAGCRVQATEYQGWKAESLANAWVTLMIVPKLGGRLMQVTFAGHPFLFINPRYKGQYYPPTESSGQPKWYNYGGDKIWPMPEGTQDDHHWPGPRADVLDDGEYSLQVISEAPRCSVRLESPQDPWTGLQYTRDISIGSDSPQIQFHCVMKNISGHPIEWSMQSVSQYDTSDPNQPGNYNRDFWAFTPVSQHSAYLEGYHVRSGLADPPSFEVGNNGLFSLHWAYLENEVWIDSPGDWLAVVDGTTGHAMVERFHVREGANYPGKATVIFYINGASLQLDEHGMPKMSSVKPDDTPYYMEAELNSPIVRLSPGETFAMNTEWFPTRVAGNLRSVTDSGVIGQPLTAEAGLKGIRLSGAFGVFFPGRLVAHLYDSRGGEASVVPLQDAEPSKSIALNQEIPAPRTVWRVSVHLEDQKGMDRGSLGDARVGENRGHP
jgi:hypothetical protein